MTPWGTPAEIETRRRMKLLIWAYAYDKHSRSLVSDGEFDKECYKVDLGCDTGDTFWDDWWQAHFVPCTGMWVNDHPDLDGIERLYQVATQGTPARKPKRKRRAT